jgi:phosphopantetheinyl transferase
VHVWWLRPALVADEAVAACERGVLSDDERRAAAEATGAAAAGALWRERVLTRALVRCALARYLPWAQVDAPSCAPAPCDPASLRFSRNDHGKPHLVAAAAAAAAAADADANAAAPSAPRPPPLEFNVTHTPELIGVAVCLAGPVHGPAGVAVALGLDAELASRRARQRKGSGRRRAGAKEQPAAAGSTGGSDGGSDDGGLTQAEEEEEGEEEEASSAATAAANGSNDDDDGGGGGGGGGDGFRRLAARRLHPSEVQALEDAAARHRGDFASAFVRMWTLKEAVVKARGVGIGHPPGLKGFAVSFGDDGGGGAGAGAGADDGPSLAAHLTELTGGLGPCGGGAAVSRLSLRWQRPADAANAGAAVLPTDDSFQLLLLRPCAGGGEEGGGGQGQQHVAALCAHALNPSDDGGTPGSPRGSRGDGPRAAGAVRRVVSRHARAAAGGDDGGGDNDGACVLAGTRWW